MFLKICGITRTSDGILAHDMGSDILGVVMSPQSPRRGSMSVINELRDLGFHVAAVHTSMMDAINMQSEEDYAQLHFDHVSEQVEQIKETGRKVISVVFENTKMERVEELSNVSDLVLLEKKPDISQHIDKFRNIIGPKVGVAGGINSVNLKKVMKYYPGIVDVSSSLESSPGIKDENRIREFFREVRRIELAGFEDS
ncbi:MAG: phosphoribosylanthranilate isomerase [Cuniculiplasma sp.]